MDQKEHTEAKAPLSKAHLCWLALDYKVRAFLWRLFSGGGPIYCENCAMGTWMPRLSPIKPGYWFHCKRCWHNKYNRWASSRPLWRRLLP